MYIFLRFKFFLFYFFIVLAGALVIGSSNVSKLSLNNGLNVFILEDPTASTVSVKAYVKTGSIDEGDFLGYGMSHYLEHIVSGGSTEFHPESYYQDLIATLGGATNAYTTTDHTCYYINTTPEHIESTLKTMNEWLFHCTFNESEYTRERNVIIKEIEKNLANVDREFYQLCQRNFYQFFPLKFPVIGYLENFKSVTKEAIESYYKEKYVPSNMILVIGGPLSKSQVKPIIDQTFALHPYQADTNPVVYLEPKPFTTRHMEKSGNLNVTYFNMRFSTIDLFSADLYPLDLIDFIISNGNDSIFEKHFVEDKKLAYSVSSSSFTPPYTRGYFSISFETDYDNIPLIKKEVFKLLNKFKSGDIEDSRIVRAKKQKISDDILSITDIDSKVSRVGLGYLYGQSIDFYDTYAKNFKQVTKKDLIRVSQQYFDESKLITTVLKPKTKDNENISSVTNNIVIKKPEKIELSNGVRVLLYPDKSIPKTLAQVMVLGGIRGETDDINGVGSIIAETMDKQSALYTNEAISKIIDDHGANMGGTVGNNTYYYALQCLSEDFMNLFPIFSDTFLNPVFNDKDIEEAKRKTLKWIDQRSDDWYSHSVYHFKKTFFKQHPYGLSKLGEKDTIKNLTRESIMDYFKSLKNPQNMVISIFGDFNQDQVLSKIESTFGTLKSSKNELPSLPIQTDIHASANSYELPIKQDVAVLLLGFDTTKLNQVEDNLKIDILDAVLSGMNYPGGRLHTQLRGEGLVYVVHAMNRTGIDQGYFFIYALTSADKVERVKSIILDHIQSVKYESITDKEFSLAKSQVKFYYKDRISSLENLAIITAADELYGRGFDHYLSITKDIDSISKDDIRKTAQQYFKNPQEFTFLQKVLKNTKVVSK
ncbi:hypothetical protein DID75_00445 [Candidatus Marinamargulisbacteria bacterium SCGC AG-410-N11]|nr:hypothetical protein DID75_00445 [Candidatus Marinamargulisbacteria bacterium SCGC AG-410-N11]